MARPLSLCLALYCRVAHAYPQEFRMLYGEDLERLGEDAAPEAWRRYGLRGLMSVLFDIAMQLPGAYLNEIRQDVRYALRVLARHSSRTPQPAWLINQNAGPWHNPLWILFECGPLIR